MKVKVHKKEFCNKDLPYPVMESFYYEFLDMNYGLSAKSDALHFRVFGIVDEGVVIMNLNDKILDAIPAGLVKQNESFVRKICHKAAAVCFVAADRIVGYANNPFRRDGSVSHLANQIFDVVQMRSESLLSA